MLRKECEMKKIAWIVTVLMATSLQPAMGADTGSEAAGGTTQKSQDHSKTPAKSAKKKSPGTMEKTGDSVKTGWHKFTKSVKQGAKKPACTPEKKSLKQC
jgi:hypothetical protein